MSQYRSISVEAHAELVVQGELLPEVAELGLLARVLGEQARDVVLMCDALLANLRGFRRVPAEGQNLCSR